MSFVSSEMEILILKYNACKASFTETLHRCANPWIRPLTWCGLTWLLRFERTTTSQKHFTDVQICDTDVQIEVHRYVNRTSQILQSNCSDNSSFNCFMQLCWTSCAVWTAVVETSPIITISRINYYFNKLNQRNLSFFSWVLGIEF